MSQATDVVQSQVDAYNERNYEVFRNFYSNDFEMRCFNGTLVLRGQRQFDEKYKDRFDTSKNRNQFVEIINRISCGIYVIDHERIEGINSDGSDKFAVLVYEVVSDKIQRVWLLPDECA